MPPVFSKSLQECQQDILPVRHVAVAAATTVDLTASFSPYARRLYVGTGGTVVGKWLGDGANVTYKNVPSGAYLDGAWLSIDATSTATDIVAEG